MTKQEKVINSMNRLLKMPIISLKRISGIPQKAEFQFNCTLGYRVFQTNTNRYVVIEEVGFFKCEYND